jgi:hypothetical protein
MKKRGFAANMTLTGTSLEERAAYRKAYMAQWRAAHPERNLSINKRRYRSLIGAGKPTYWAGEMMCRIRTRDKGTTLTKEALLAAWNRQGGRCAWTGLPMVIGANSPWTVSVDRRDNSLGYADHNVILTTWFANRARGKMDEITFNACLTALGVGATYRLTIDRDVLEN